ncbi:TPA: single-stranded DNA-binding protein [Neisseria gonorrhoeae]|uniref:Single-stranded DNA-binding protein n=4 Tax=Neisseria gonorrhoeae TaxID=485 RepID=A0AB74EFN7_NEIGO|nr:single-stranded DNA-binding protein [Neisseria gonorrhoeae]SBN10371.1 single-stranded DNA binding protein [Neisseria gonorrhoeae]SBQ20812.1 single-stranded DNA binding protein [Neisseria gonorrhoeae]SBQ22131.1 single-stranded DNA binding protein [Neisseria gonorrhoeae]SCW14523.1 Single-stranded DNA-binding protein 1 [Neisseria gonorrhoeae]STZ91938.1 single-stranded DNA binding protein [Neisseria gonorrhoeae]
MFYNRIQIMGNLGKDPEIRYFADGTPSAKLSVAYTEKWRDKQTGEPRERTEWFTVLLTKNQAETAAKYLHKGDTVQVAGKMQSRHYTDKDGAERTVYEIHTNELLIIKTRKSNDLEQADAPEN